MTDTDSETYTANVRIHELPRECDRVLGVLASMRSMLKWEIVREALVEYVERHKDEITRR